MTSTTPTLPFAGHLLKCWICGNPARRLDGFSLLASASARCPAPVAEHRNTRHKIPKKTETRLKDGKIMGNRCVRMCVCVCTPATFDCSCTSLHQWQREPEQTKQNKGDECHSGKNWSLRGLHPDGRWTKIRVPANRLMYVLYSPAMVVDVVCENWQRTEKFICK